MIPPTSKHEAKAREVARTWTGSLVELTDAIATALAEERAATKREDAEICSDIAADFKFSSFYRHGCRECGAAILASIDHSPAERGEEGASHDQ